MIGQEWAPGDVYFGDPEQKPINWREEATETDIDDNIPPTDEELNSVYGMLGIDAGELFSDDVPVPSVKPSPFRKN